MGELLVEQGEVIGAAGVGVIALIGLLIVQLIRRRRDVKRARVAVRLASYSINPPRPGPIAVAGTWHQSDSERWLACSGQRVALDGDVEIVSGTAARWKSGTRTYKVRNGDAIIAIGVMSPRAEGDHTNADWRLVASPGESGIQIFAKTPRPAPPPLFPWRAPLILAVFAAGGYFGLYEVGTMLVDVPRNGICAEDVLRFEVASALPGVRAQALKLRADAVRCR
jgi:hypothetical protein